MVREFGQTRKERSQEKEGRCEYTQCVYSVGSRQIPSSVKLNLLVPDAALGTEEMGGGEGHRPALRNSCSHRLEDALRGRRYIQIYLFTNTYI